MERKTLPEITAERFVERIDDLAGRPGLTINRLAGEFRVSHKTMWRAVQILQDRGTVTAHPKRGIIIRMPGLPDPPGRAHGGATDAAVELAEELEGRIRDGMYKAGRAMPKSLAFAIEEHRSPVTVQKAHKILAAKNLIHKKGKKWIVGPCESRSPDDLRTGPRRDGPVVLVLLPAFHTWLRICQNRIFATPFFNGADDELAAYGYSLQAVMYGEKQRPGRPFPSGREAIAAMIASLGKRYAGCLIYLPKRTGSRMELCRWLLHFGRPVLLFDATPMEGREYTGIVRGIKVRNHFFHCYFFEEQGNALALDALVSRGHATIGFPRAAAPAKNDFIADRIAVLRRYAAALRPQPQLVVRDQPEDFLFSAWEFRWSTPGAIFSRLESMALNRADPGASEGPVSRRPASHRQLLTTYAPSMVGLFNEDGVTAIIAANDSLAMSYYHWAWEVGLSIPADFSLVSFDNRRELATYPISSVDFGLRDLGYRAAHAIIRDFPPRGDDATGTMHSKPFLVDRGSIGKPRSGALLRW